MASATSRQGLARRGTAAALAALVAASAIGFSRQGSAEELPIAQRDVEWRSLDGTGNNLLDPDLGSAGLPYARDAEALYADGIGVMASGPDARFVSNRIFNDTGQNLFSPGGVSHWASVWGQFLDHTIGLRRGGDEEAPLAFDASDPLEVFTNDLGGIGFTRSAAADGTGLDDLREQINTVSSFVDAWAVYGGSLDRLDWLRVGSLDGDPSNNDATLLTTSDGYLPTALERNDAAAAPAMEIDGGLRLDPGSAVIAGDVRANENLGLTAVHTLFVREHNRIVEALPDLLDEETKFEIARRVVAAEQQWITYSEFLPAMGVDLSAYDGYDAGVDPSITNEFATVGYRAHSMIHGRLNAEAPVGTWSTADIAAFETAGIQVELDGGIVTLAIPLNVAFFDPGLLPLIGLDEMLEGLASHMGYRNDEQIDNQLRSVLFQIPAPGAEDPMACLDGANLPDCFEGVIDLGALDIERGRDHGMPSYNDMRVAYGLEPASSFIDITGETTASFPAGLDANDPAILDFIDLRDVDGRPIEAGTVDVFTSAVTGTRRSTLAARLQSVYGDVDAVDAFVGMVSEPIVAGTELGELQLAMWKAQFTSLRDGDRFFYANDPLLADIRDEFGIDFRMSLGEVIEQNTDADVQRTVFVVEQPDDDVDTPTPTRNDADRRAQRRGGEGDRPRPRPQPNQGPPPGQRGRGPGR